MFTPFTGTSKQRSINLGSRDPAAQLSSTAVLARAREERRVRERTRLEGTSAQTIQRTWRGRRAAGLVARRLLDEVDVAAGVLDRRREGRAVALVCRRGLGSDVDGRRRRALARWAEQAVQMGQSGCPAAIQGIQGAETYPYTIIRLGVLGLDVISRDPLLPEAAACARLLEMLFSAASYAALASGERCRAAITERIARSGWVERLTQGLRTVSPASKKHPNMPLLIRLLTLPLDTLHPDSPILPDLVPAYFHTLLEVPSLPALMPLASLTYFCAHLPLFPAIIPAVLARSEAFAAGAIRTERGRTELLANLVTLVVRGGLLARQDATGAGQWMEVVGRLLSGMDEQWGMWVEARGIWARGADEPGAARPRVRKAGPGDESDKEMDVDTEDEARTGMRARVRARGSVAPALAGKILPLLEPLHLLGLVGQALRNQALVLPVVSYIQGLLSAFRGSPRWESILDVLLEGDQGRKLIRQLWRAHVRGRWSRSAVKDNWEKMFAADTATASDAGQTLAAPFLLLSTLYIHHLLSIPDAEFFSPESTERNALSIDEVTELAGIWRDLAFYGYWVGVGASEALVGAAKRAEEKKREEVRALMTKGVVAVRARDARRRFTPPEYWIMTSEFNLHSFVEAVLLEESQLDAPEPIPEEDPAADQLVAAVRPPPWMRGRRHISKRQMAFISPRLGLLNNLPMTVPFETRVEIFQQFIRNDRERLGIDQYIRRHGSRHSARIRRSNLSEDGFKELNKLGRLLKGTIEIKFYDEWGNREAGIDGGGLFKEFLTSLSKEVFDTDRGLWLATSQNELYPNPHSYATEPHQLEWYSFIGRVLGKAMYEGILVDVSFAGFFLAKWLERQSFLDDLASLDKDLYKGLIALKNYPGDPEDLALNFTIAEDDFGATRSIDLVHDGSNISVNRANRNEYIQLVCDYKLNRQISKQCFYFFSGLSEMIDPKWLRMFDQQELQTLLGGTESPIDVDDFHRHTVMSDSEDDVTYELFWKVVRSFSQEQLKALLKFVTSCARPPLLGFGDLQPKFGIRLTVNDTTRLPSASSCFNLLKLPRYKDESTLRSKLLQAITSGAGFDLS